MTDTIATGDLSKSYLTGVKAIDSVTLSVRQGEVFGLLGPNGAGKTTFVKLLLGLLKPDSGSITIHGHDILAQRDVPSKVSAYLSQNPTPFSDLKVSECIEYTALLRGIPPALARQGTNELMDLFGLTKQASKLFSALSGGSRRLVGVCAALVGYRPLLILDEPTTHLDITNRRRLWDEIRRRNHEFGTTVILVTHDVLEAEQVLDRVGFINDGRVTAIGTPTELRARLGDTMIVTLASTAPNLSVTLPWDATRVSEDRLQIQIARANLSRFLATLSDVVPPESIQALTISTGTLQDVYAKMRDESA